MAHLWAATVCLSLITTKKELQYYEYCTLPCAKVTEDHRPDDAYAHSESDQGTIKNHRIA